MILRRKEGGGYSFQRKDHEQQGMVAEELIWVRMNLSVSELSSSRCSQS